MNTTHAHCLATTFTNIITTPPLPTDTPLRLIREEIATQYKMTLQEALAQAEIAMGDADRKLIYAHKSFVGPMLII